MINGIDMTNKPLFVSSSFVAGKSFSSGRSDPTRETKWEVECGEIIIKNVFKAYLFIIKWNEELFFADTLS